MPSRINKAFTSMKTCCPAEITSYSFCITACKEDSIEKNQCQKEFDALKKCFRTVRLRK